MNWIDLHTASQLNEILERSTDRLQVIFKHSTRCATSQMVKRRLERSEAPPAIDFYYLDLLSYRPISNQVAETFRVNHESPQVLVIRNGKCIHEESHIGITMEDILEQDGLN
jgi:monothiol bacilliredoxin